MSFHAAALFAKWNDTKATAFLESLKSNGAVIAAGNSDVKDRVSDGRVDVGILDEDDAAVALREKKPVGLVILDQDDPDALGTPLMPNAALLIHGARGAKPPQHVEIEGPLVRSCDIDSPAVESIVSHGQDCRGRPGIGCRSSCSPRAMPFLMQ